MFYIGAEILFTIDCIFKCIFDSIYSCVSQKTNMFYYSDCNVPITIYQHLFLNHFSSQIVCVVVLKTVVVTDPYKKIHKVIYLP